MIYITDILSFIEIGLIASEKYYERGIKQTAFKTKLKASNQRTQLLIGSFVTKTLNKMLTFKNSIWKKKVFKLRWPTDV